MSKRILVVDDEKAVREVLCSMLNSLGYNTCSVTSGQEAIDFFEKNQSEGGVDLVILDMTMPKMNGKETFFRLCQLDPRVQVVFFSGVVPDMEEGKNCRGFIPKPIRIEDLELRIEEVVNEKKR